MREIKFRAWYANQEMHYDIAPIDNEYYIFFETQKRNAHDLQINRAITIMQYTGLKDKNGKEIYEGDIVNLTHMVYTGYGNIDEVTEAVVIEDITKLPFGPSTITCEVIGNIYENPELLEGEK